MSVFGRLFGGDAAPALPRSEPYLAPVKAELTPEGPLDEVIRERLSGGIMSAAGVPVSVGNVERLAAVAACVRVLANDVAHLPLPIYRRLGNGREEARDHPLYLLLMERPNQWQSAFEFRQMLMRDLCFQGNGYALKVRGNGGRVIELWRLHPKRVSPKQNKTTMEVTYRVSREEGAALEVPRSEILHLRGPSDDGIEGLSPVRVHRETLGLGLALKQHGAHFFAHGAKPGAVLTTKHDLPKEDRDDLRDDFDAAISGPGNAFKTIILPLEMDLKTMKMSMEDQQYIEASKFNRSEIAGIFGVPSYKIGDLERATFSNIEHQSIDYVRSSLMPWLVLWEQALRRDLLDGEPDIYYRHTVDALLRGTAKERAEALRLQRLSGVINANEWRAKENLNPREDPGGEEYIVEGNTRPGDGSGAGAVQEPPRQEPEEEDEE